MIDELLRAVVLALALFLGQAGIAFFVVGLAPGRSAPWWKQYGYSAVCLTGAYYLLVHVFMSP